MSLNTSSMRMRLSSRRSPGSKPGEGAGRGEVLLLAARPWFIWGSLLVALLVEFLPLGRHPWLPDVLAATLVFWAVHQPRRVGIGAGFLLGLLVDVQQGALLGEHALAYTLLAFLAVALHRRLLWFSLPQQALQVLPLFFAAQILEFIVRMATGGSFPGWSFFLAPVLQALLWPGLSWLLLAPQRRAPDTDQNRPL
ncbi:putative Rod shape-determining protein mreD [Thiomonas delicata]|jgi:rod shape-determining protein MreD|uniref:Putative Rod shape-determining protein mreD n=2 Tax=Thiomonas delicata TaxID=364030 RepID=A0A238D0S6_THIDL|nr:putative Rod shape-determining protein mreD [Thiomonas delicata]